MSALVEFTKARVSGTRLHRPLAVMYKRWYFRHAAEQRRLQQWHQANRCFPPPHLAKQQVILEYAHRYGLKQFVETGTYLGLMVQAMVAHFDSLFTIELDPYLADRARRRFKPYSHVHVIEGDSGQKLLEVVEQLNDAALFWLDGHASGGITAEGEQVTPIFDELRTIFGHHNSDHVILVDDARCFGHDRGYPTLQATESVVREIDPKAIFEVVDDIIRITRTKA